jgi:hypothetical protein
MRPSLSPLPPCHPQSMPERCHGLKIELKLQQNLSGAGLAGHRRHPKLPTHFDLSMGLIAH